MQLLLPPPYFYTLRMRSIYKRADVVYCLDEIDRKKNLIIEKIDVSSIVIKQKYYIDYITDL